MTTSSFRILKQVVQTSEKNLREFYSIQKKLNIFWGWSEWHDLDYDGLIEFPKAYLYNTRTEAEERLRDFKTWEREYAKSQVKVLNSEVVYTDENL